MTLEKQTFDIIEADKRKKARSTAEMRYGFRWNLALYPIVNAGLFMLWFFTGTIDNMWPLIPVGFWGIALIAHYFAADRSFGGGWIEKETDKILEDLS